MRRVDSSGNDSTSTATFHKSMSYSRAGSLNKQDAMMVQAKTLLERAVSEFAKVNHWRGLYIAYRNLEQLVSRASDIMSVGSHQINTSLEKKRFTEQYKKYLDFYDMQRSYNDKVADLTIQRTGGDDLSLQTEIVTRKGNAKLFTDPEGYDVVKPLVPNSLIKNTSTLLSQV